tara:strand:+ start:992 stop:1279 length:288 start_codon:yes stop_codon:yes gene_type:complete
MWALLLIDFSIYIRDLHKFNPRSKSNCNAGVFMGIHYDYKSTRGEKAMKKEAKKKARLEQRRAKKNTSSSDSDKDKMHDIQKTITLEDLTNPDKN